MARAKQRTRQVEEVRPYVEGVAKNLIDKLYGPDGPAWGTKLTELEDLVVALRDVLGEKMLAEALARQAVSAASVAHLLDQQRRARRQPPPVEIILPADPRVRDLRVTPHALSTYDKLLTPIEPHEEDSSDDSAG